MDIEVGLATKEDKEILEKRIDCYLSHNFTVVARDREKIVGTLQWYVKEDPNAGVAEFEEVHVLEDYRGNKIGSMLVDFAIQSVRDYFEKNGLKPRKIYLFVSNEIAMKLYEKHGFKKVCDAGFLFWDNDREILYTLDL